MIIKYIKDNKMWKENYFKVILKVKKVIQMNVKLINENQSKARMKKIKEYL